jgi:hypothetical protein
MTGISINVVCNGQKDPSRWLTIQRASEDEVTIRLQDLVHPGMGSNLKSFTCPLPILRDVTKSGFVQIRVQEGYCQFKAKGQLVDITFKGSGDRTTTRCEVELREFADLLQAKQPERAVVSA